jgi:iron complex outermembrane recepter protein
MNVFKKFGSKKHRLFSSGSLVSLAIVSSFTFNTNSFAQERAPSAGDVSEILVTASRIVRDGYQAPTPTTILNADEIKRDASVNVAEYLLKVPTFAGSVYNNGSTTSAGLPGISSMSLRNLSPQRTLVLLDGQRLPAATTGDFVDINAIPNGIIKRIDVVTGGASAAWGSDAVAGVVNFVIDKDFTGLRGEVSGGATQHGDNENLKVSLTAGTKFAGGRGKLMVSGETSFNDGVSNVSERDWYEGYRQVVNPAYAAGNGQPFYLVANNVGPVQVAPGAIVTAGPLAGTVFGEGGQVSRLNFGQVAANSAYMVGGDWKVGDWHPITQNLQVPLSHQNLFARVSYDVSDSVTLYSQIMYGRSYLDAMTTPYYQYGGITIQRDNAFLPASIVSAMQARNLTSLTVGSWNQAIGALPYESEKELFRYTLGGIGEFGLFGTSWKWDAYVTRNESHFKQDYTVPIMANYGRAIDAVMGPNGVPVCRSTLTNPSNGCAPFNILGTGVATSAGLDYVMGLAQLDARIVQDIFSASISGEPFSTWAGPVSVAAGVEHRRDKEDGTSDPISKARGYWAGNYNPLIGSYEVTEGFIEVAAPLLNDSFLGKSLELNGAVRHADYSTSGGVTPWKVGVTYTPVDDVTLRVTRSRDIRAGSLSVLFQPGQTLTQALFNPWTGATQTTQFTTYGNPTISPERADTKVIGAVFRPRWVPGLTFSADYWDINVEDAITTISVTALIDGCYTGQFPQYCPNVGRNPDNSFTAITLTPVNLAYVNVRGLDLELGYRVPVGQGELSLRALATNGLKNVTNNGLPNAVDVDVLGLNNNMPDWRYTISATYNQGSFTGALTARGLSSGVYRNENIECRSNCPANTAANPTISDNTYGGALYFDLALNYVFFEGLEGFATVTNVANKDPEPYAHGPGVGNPQWGVLPSAYDYLGRSFRAGVRFEF